MERAAKVKLVKGMACRCIPDEEVRRAIELKPSLLSFNAPARKTVFHLFRYIFFSIDFFVRIKKCRHSKNLQQPIEP
jgi:hypothetical protein